MVVVEVVVAAVVETAAVDADVTTGEVNPGAADISTMAGDDKAVEVAAFETLDKSAADEQTVEVEYSTSDNTPLASMRWTIQTVEKRRYESLSNLATKD